MKKREYILLFLILCCLFSCEKKNRQECSNYRQAMRDFVIQISSVAKQCNPNFIIIPQNGIELIAMGKDAESELAWDYLSAIDGHGQEDLFYGYYQDEVPTPVSESDRLLGYLRRSSALGNHVLVTDYCALPSHVEDSYLRCVQEGFISFSAHRRNLDAIPACGVREENDEDILSLSQARNFLYLINPEQFANKTDFINAVCATNYDILIMDLFLDGEVAFNAVEVERLRHKANGGRRLVMGYMSIGEAEDYRYYWQSSWNKHRPEWMDKENSVWSGNYKVCYWYKEWQDIICGSGDSYLNRILAAGFDGVYLDVIDAYEYFEE